MAFVVEKFKCELRARFAQLLQFRIPETAESATPQWRCAILICWFPVMSSTPRSFFTLGGNMKASISGLCRASCLVAIAAFLVSAWDGVDAVGALCIYKANNSYIGCQGDFLPDCSLTCTENENISCTSGAAHSNLVFPTEVTSGGNQKSTPTSFPCTLDVSCVQQIFTHGGCPASTLYLYCGNDPLVLAGCKQCNITLGDWHEVAGYLLTTTGCGS